MRILTIFLAIIFSFCSIAAQASSNPEAVPAQLQKAIDLKDSGQAMPYLDLEKIVKNVFDETLPQINESVRKGELVLSPPLAAALGSLNSGNAASKRLAEIFLASELTKFIIYGVDSGAFSGNPLPKNERMIMDGGIFNKFGEISLARKEFSQTSLISKNNNTATIATSLYDYGVKQAYKLRLRLQLADGIWRVVAIENAAELYKELVPQN